MPGGRKTNRFLHAATVKEEEETEISLWSIIALPGAFSELLKQQHVYVSFGNMGAFPWGMTMWDFSACHLLYSTSAYFA